MTHSTNNTGSLSLSSSSSSSSPAPSSVELVSSVDAYVNKMRMAHEALFDAKLDAIADEQGDDFDYNFKCDNGKIFITYTDQESGNEKEVEVELPTFRGQNTQPAKEVAPPVPNFGIVSQKTQWIGTHKGEDLYLVHAEGGFSGSNLYPEFNINDDFICMKPGAYTPYVFALNAQGIAVPYTFTQGGEKCRLKQDGKTISDFEAREKKATIDTTTRLPIEGKPGQYLHREPGVKNASNPEKIYYSMENDLGIYEARKNDVTGKYTPIRVTCTTDGRVVEPTWIGMVTEDLKGKLYSRHCYVLGNNPGIFITNEHGFLEPYLFSPATPWETQYSYNPKTKAINLVRYDEGVTVTGKCDIKLDSTNVLPLHDQNEPNNPNPILLELVSKRVLGNILGKKAADRISEPCYRIYANGKTDGLFYRISKTLPNGRREVEALSHQHQPIELAQSTVLSGNEPLFIENWGSLQPETYPPYKVLVPGLGFQVYRKQLKSIAWSADQSAADRKNSIEPFMLYTDAACTMPLTTNGINGRPKWVVLPGLGYDALSKADKNDYVLVADHIKYRDQDMHFESPTYTTKKGGVRHSTHDSGAHLFRRRDRTGAFVEGSAFIKNPASEGAFIPAPEHNGFVFGVTKEGLFTRETRFTKMLAAAKAQATPLVAAATQLNAGYGIVFDAPNKAKTSLPLEITINGQKLTAVRDSKGKLVMRSNPHIGFGLAYRNDEHEEYAITFDSKNKTFRATLLDRAKSEITTTSFVFTYNDERIKQLPAQVAPQPASVSNRASTQKSVTRAIFSPLGGSPVLIGTHRSEQQVAPPQVSVVAPNSYSSSVSVPAGVDLSDRTKYPEGYVYNPAIEALIDRTDKSNETTMLEKERALAAKAGAAGANAAATVVPQKQKTSWWRNPFRSNSSPAVTQIIQQKAVLAGMDPTDDSTLSNLGELDDPRMLTVESPISSDGYPTAQVVAPATVTRKANRKKAQSHTVTLEAPSQKPLGVAGPSSSSSSSSPAPLLVTAPRQNGSEHKAVVVMDCERKATGPRVEVRDSSLHNVSLGATPEPKKNEEEEKKGFSLMRFLGFGNKKPNQPIIIPVSSAASRRSSVSRSHSRKAAVVTTARMLDEDTGREQSQSRSSLNGYSPVSVSIPPKSLVSVQGTYESKEREQEEDTAAGRSSPSQSVFHFVDVYQDRPPRVEDGNMYDLASTGDLDEL